MKILVLSDSHRDKWNIQRAIKSARDSDVVIFLGDGENDFRDMHYEFPEKMFLQVAGNCDFCSDYPLWNKITLSGKKIFYTHGHSYHVKRGVDLLIKAAREKGADICLFGHTHSSMTSYDNGLYIMNPGSLYHPSSGMPSFGIIEITEKGGIFMNIIKEEKWAI